MEFEKIICEARENSPEVICPLNRAQTPGTRNYYQVSIDRTFTLQELHHSSGNYLPKVPPTWHVCTAGSRNDFRYGNTFLG